MIKHIDRGEVERIAVTLEFYDLRAGVLLPLLPLGAGKLRQTCRRLLPLKPSGYRAAEHHPQAAAENCSGSYDFTCFHR